MNNDELPHLTACPFCGKGHAAVLVSSNDMLREDDEPYDTETFAVLCDASSPGGPGGCGASGGYFHTKAQAVAAWNRRGQLVLETAEEARADRERAERYFRQAEQLLVADWVTVATGGLPEDRAEVLFYSDDLRNPASMLLGMFIDGDFCCAGHVMTNVTHWAPKPLQPGEAGLKAIAGKPAVRLEDIEQYRMQMAGISTAALGYWKEGDGIHPDYDTPALRDVARLYAKYAELAG